MYFKGTKQLTVFIFKQQRFKILIWLVSLVGITLSVATAYPTIYKDEPSRQAASMTMDNPAMIAMLGPGYEKEGYILNIGAMFAHEMLLFTAIAVAIMSILLVGRATRSDEEDGQIEMIRALSVGRLSYLSAVMIVIVATNIGLMLLIGSGLALLGIEGIEVEGSFLYGAILGTTGILFTAFTAVFAQLTETARGTAMLSFLLLVSSYLMRAIGDISSEWLSFISPIGWTVRTGVFVDNHWWLVALAFLIATALVILAFYLHSIRDLGSGFIAAKSGKTHASPFLQTLFGLTFTLQKTSIVAWAIGLFVLSSSFGAILGDLEAYFADVEIMQAYIAMDSEYTLTEQFLTLIMAIMSLISLIPVLMVLLKLKGEETKNLTENLFSRTISRTRLLGNYCSLAVVVSIIMQSLIALGLWSVGGVVMEEPLSFLTTFSSAFVYLPAIWVVSAIAIVFVGAVPKFPSLIWLYVVYCFIVIYLGDLLKFPEWMKNLSVFDYIPKIPADNMNFFIMVFLMLIAVVLTVIGFIGYTKRDIAG